MIGLGANLFYYVNAPLVSLRKAPTEESEVVSQGYYSEKVHLLQEEGVWQKIETCVDSYQGWIKSGSLQGRVEPFPKTPPERTARITRLMAHLYKIQDTAFGPMLTLPFDAQLEIVDPERDIEGRWIEVTMVNGDKGYIQRGDIKVGNTPLTLDQLPQFSRQFLGLPYTWGGRTSFGYDCSGFVQMLFRQIGIFIPRDSNDQAKLERFQEIPIEDLKPCDLLFFGLDSERIRHVGMYIGNGQFIHATVGDNAPYIHLSSILDHEWSGQGRYPYRTARILKS